MIACLIRCQLPGQLRQPSPSILEGGRTEAITTGQEADAQIALGRAAEQRGEFDQAMLAYRAGLKRDKSRVDAYHRLAVIHDKQGKFRESAELYRQARRRPRTPTCSAISSTACTCNGVGPRRKAACDGRSPWTRSTVGPTTTSGWSWPATATPATP